MNWSNYISVLVCLVVGISAHSGNAPQRLPDSSCLSNLLSILEHRYSEADETFYRVIPVSEPTPRELEILRGLEKDGGEGKVIIIRDVLIGDEKLIEKVEEYDANQNDGSKHQVRRRNDGRIEVTQDRRVIQVLSPPTSHRFGRAVREVHQILTSKGIPLVIHPNLPFGVAGIARVYRAFLPNEAKAVMMLPARRFLRGSVTLRHELQHIFDMVTESQAFLESLPRLPKSFDKIVERIRNGESLSPLQRLRLQHAEVSPKIVAEAKASERSVMSLFKSRGLNEVVLTRNVANELATVMIELGNSSFRNFQLLYFRMWIDPLNSNNIVVGAKAGVYGYVFLKMTWTGGVWLIEGIDFALSSLVDDENAPLENL